jgi:hypothetical protein
LKFSALILSLFNDKDSIKEYEVDDIQNIYKTLVEISFNNVDLMKEYYYFVRNVMDDEEKASIILLKIK